MSGAHRSMAMRIAPKFTAPLQEWLFDLPLPQKEAHDEPQKMRLILPIG
jgi:hypothetical protein